MKSPVWNALLLSQNLLLTLSFCHGTTTIWKDYNGRAGRLPSQQHHDTNPHEDRPGHTQQHRLLQAKQPYPRDYRLLPSDQIKDRLDDWNSRYGGELVSVTTSQETFQLPAAGNANDCPFYPETGCPNYIVTIQDFVTHPEGSYSSNNLPEILWSGSVHGDERVGPTAVVEAADLLLSAAACEALPKYANSNSNDSDSGGDINSESWKLQVEQARQCRATLAEHGIDDAHRKWLARLVATRRIVILPTANALGYFRNERQEGDTDPNRDFPYDLDDGKLCMQTIAARSLNEVYREHMFQLALTFHAGMEVVGYEWGAPSWLEHLSPDDQAQAQIASAYSHVAGGFSGTQPYQTGTMNDLVYYVRGGMEDWAYAGSWDTERVITCTPKTFGGYAAQKTHYNNSTLRVFNMLVETSDRKTPQKDTLGSSLNVLNGTDLPSNGHVARNIRLALLAADLVQPYLSIVGVNDLRLSDDVVPKTDLLQDRTKCQAIRTVRIPPKQQSVTIQWTVGGALSIDATAVYFAKWNDIPEDALDCLSQPESSEFTTLMQQGTIVGDTNGTGYFASSGPQPTPTPKVLGPIFQAKLDLSSFDPRDKVVVVAMARVDQDWTQQPANVAPEVPPQSHIVNARTNPTWHHESAGKRITGRREWFSMPLTIIIGNYYYHPAGHEQQGSGTTIELSSRIETAPNEEKGPTSSDSSNGSPYQLRWTHVVGFVMVVFVCGVSVVVCLRYRTSVKHQRLVNELYEEEGAFHENGSGRSRKNAVNVNCYSDDIDEDFDDDDVDELELTVENGNGSISSRKKEADVHRYTID